MQTADYLTTVEAVGGAAEALVQDVPRDQTVARLGKRLRGTDTFTAPPDCVEGLVVLRPVDAARSDWYIGEVMPGGQLVNVLLKYEAGRWGPPGNLVSAAKTSVLPLQALQDDAAQAAAFRSFALATTKNSGQVASIRRRAATANAVMGPSLTAYDEWVAEHPDESRMSNLTAHLLAGVASTREIIQARSAGRHEDAEEILRSVINSLRRSAGTNYQGLVALAIAEELLKLNSAWYIEHPPPRDYMKAMAIRFTGSADYAVDIDPDIDVLIRNSAWVAGGAMAEPVVMLSVKTSLADRAGAAARWKMYFDVATRTCPFDGHIDGCAWHEQGVRFARPDLTVHLKHCIVTANIYKMTSDTRFAEEGELGTAQTKANTFMFDRRYATRIGDAVEMTGWEPLTDLIALLNELADEQSLPR